MFISPLWDGTGDCPRFIRDTVSMAGQDAVLLANIVTSDKKHLMLFYDENMEIVVVVLNSEYIGYFPKSFYDACMDIFERNLQTKLEILFNLKANGK